MKIFVVMGTAGQYSDREEWPVKAFTSKSRAEEFVSACDKLSNALDIVYHRNRWDVPKNAHALDPDFRLDCTGTNYFFYGVELEEEVNELATREL